MRFFNKALAKADLALIKRSRITNAEREVKRVGQLEEQLRQSIKTAEQLRTKLQAQLKNELLILTEDIIDSYPQIAMEVLGLSTKFKIPLGWHYLLDLTWVLNHLAHQPPCRILDAGGGNGLLQFILASYGHSVVSVDAIARTPPAGTTKFIPVHHSGYAETIQTDYVSHLKFSTSSPQASKEVRAKVANGEIEYHCGNLENLQHLDTDEFDAVVSISALEHNPPEKIPRIMGEIRRVAKPNAPLLLTISTAASPGFHDASHSWILTEKEIVEAYNLTNNYYTNFDDLNALTDKLSQSPRLSRWLAAFYFTSGDNGMPWGIWKPQYLPVGVFVNNRPA